MKATNIINMQASRLSDITITEVSLSFEVTVFPQMCVNVQIPYAVSTLGAETERAIRADEEDIKAWIKDPQPDTMRFVYSSPLQDVECSYSNIRSSMTLYGIKYKNIELFSGYVNNLLILLETESVGMSTTRYKAVAKREMRTEWNQHVLADIITNDPDMAQVIAVCERTSTLCERRLFSVAIASDNMMTCRVALTHRGNIVHAMMSKLSDEEDATYAANVLERLFLLYEEKMHKSATLSVSGHPAKATSEIEALRNVFSELFVNNYTRECPVLPIILSAEEAERVRHTHNVIEYFGMYFTAPEGYFVGLKRNRLSNRDVFPCLVTCYLHDHMLRRESETFKYYNSSLISGRESNKKRPLPKCIQDPNYHRIKADSFVDAVESATRVKMSQFQWYPHIAKQELWDKPDDDIMETIRYGPGSLAFRYFEEAFRVSIHVVVIKDGNFESLVPPHRGKYVWSPPHPLHVVIFETYRTTYGEKHCSYDYLTKGEETLFDEHDSVVKDLTAQKNACSIRPVPLDENTISEQVIDRNGKCSLVVTENGSVATYTRPLAVPVTCEPMCFFDRHIRKLNKVKLEMGLKPVSASKRSTNDILYFPNDESYVFYTSSRKQRA